MIRHKCTSGEIIIMESKDFIPEVNTELQAILNEVKSSNQMVGIVSPSALTTDDTRAIFQHSVDNGPVTRAWSERGGFTVGRKKKLVLVSYIKPPRTFMPNGHDDVIIGDVSTPTDVAKFVRLLNAHESHFLWRLNML